MGKVKIKLTNGVVEEKNIISSFKVGLDSFVIIDSESTGSMGLPIILVSKLVDNKLTKIIDQNEWQKTKEYLKLIISNAEMEYISEAIEYNADEIYFTQLTLPQASFDAIKANYKPIGTASVVTAPVIEAEPFIPNIEVAPIENITTPAVETIPEVVPVTPVIESVPEIAPVVPIVPPTPVVDVAIPVVTTPAIPEVNPVIATPVVETVQPVEQFVPVMETVAPVIPVAPVEQVVMPVIPEVPVVQSVQETVPAVAPSMPSLNVSEDKYKDMKETFMKSCENMFDALVNQLENKN